MKLERDFDALLCETLDITCKDNGYWLLAVPLYFMGAMHEISAMSTYKTSMGNGYLVVFDRYGEDIDLALSFTLKPDGGFNSYNRFSPRIKSVLMYLADIIAKLEEQYPDLNADLEDNPVELDITPENIDMKVYIDMITDKEVA